MSRKSEKPLSSGQTSVQSPARRQSKELKQTLLQLEDAIRQWEGIMVEETKEQEVPKKAQVLLTKLKAQIDELSE